MPTSTPDDRAFAAEIYRRLLAAYGEPTWRPYYQPLDELVLTFLSQNTSDLNSGRAFEALKARYPTWQAVLDAPVAELAETIRSGGLAQQKAPRIQAALRRIQAERGAFTLDFLADLPVAEATRWLTSFDGIGHKTASIVLLFCFNQPAFPVDTHVGHVTRRLGLAGPKDSEEKIKSDLGKPGTGGVVLSAAPEPDPARARSLPCATAPMPGLRTCRHLQISSKILNTATQERSLP